MIRRPPRSTRVRSSAASDVYKRQVPNGCSHIHFLFFIISLFFPALSLISSRTPSCSHRNRTRPFFLRVHFDLDSQLIQPSLRYPLITLSFFLYILLNVNSQLFGHV